MKKISIFQTQLLKFLFVCLIAVSSSNCLLAQKRDTVYANIAAINQPFMLNRLGAAMPTGMIFALISDLAGDTVKPGIARLAPDKRPRPIVIRANKGDVLMIRFKNLLVPYDPARVVNAYNTNKPDTVGQFSLLNNFGNYLATHDAGIHIKGMEMADNISDDGSFNGNNASSLAKPGEVKNYVLLAAEEGTFLMYSTADDIDNNGGVTGAQMTLGLFGTINIQPKTAEWYRSQVTQAELDMAITGYNKLSGDSANPIVTPLNKNSVPDIYKTTNIFPVVDYNASFPTGNKNAGKPILKMYKQIRPNYRELIYTDLTAIITGPNAGNFPANDPSPSFDMVPASPDRRAPYREFSIDYHEEPYAVQAFPVLATGSLTATLNSGKDGFAINYGTAGIGAEVYANRIKVGPMANCADCAYEEFFLSAWAVGDPSMVVDIPANSSGGPFQNSASNQTLQNQLLLANGTNSSISNPSIMPKASKTLYPDDPSNVYHSYMNDHVKFRVTHAGMGIAHVHHQHAHQWLHTPNSDDSHYMDSQLITPGSSYTLEMVYGGSGNLNKTVGDQIFHCHFYPHFAAGMWSMWRVHDVLELGTKLDNNGIPLAGARALPDGEITKGTPIPGLVPIPTLAMATVPAETHIENGQVVVNDISKNPGFPFFIPGIAGSRPPNPPLDYAQSTLYNAQGDSIGFGTQNGGLPRSVVLNANVAFHNETKYDWTKIIDSIQIIELPDAGTVVEKVAMATHAVRKHPTVTPSGKPGDFILNGRPPVPGAPFADPAIDAEGDPVGTKRIYKAAVIQLDAVLNKKGWHYPQQRIESLWGDVENNINGKKPPEPLFMRANSKDDYIEFWHTNLVPEYYELDNYQVRTPTDIIGQHIHLVKFDVTSSDGAANGFNYEDGTLSPDVVRERIKGINNGGKHYQYTANGFQPDKPITNTSQYSVSTVNLTPQFPNPKWGKAPDGQNWIGAQTTIQRWYADPLTNNRGYDRTLTTVFTHDHFGPSTHQQIGLYAGLLIEPTGSTWLNASTGTALGTRYDGGPTSWQSNIIVNGGKDSYRELMLEFQDNQLAYLPTSKSFVNPYPKYPENPNSTNVAAFKTAVSKYKGWLDTTNAIFDNKGSELISFGGQGTYSVNYRNEPLPLRVSNGPVNNRVQSTGQAGDLSYAYKSITRADPAFNRQPEGGNLIKPSQPYSVFKFPVDPIGPGMQPTDPYTPMFRAYEGDSIQIRTLVGAHVTSHFFNVHGANWLFEPTYENSGYKSTQNMGLSEHFEMNFRFPTTQKTQGDSSFTDYLYNASADRNGLTAGLWGLMRVYKSKQSNSAPLATLPNNTDPSVKKAGCGCPAGAPQVNYEVSAVNIKDVEKYYKNLIYNRKYGYYFPQGVIYMLDSDLDKINNFFRSNPSAAIPPMQIEPLVLRANAGACINVKLTNRLKATDTLWASQINAYNYFPPGPTGTPSYQINNLSASSTVGLHAELLSTDISKNDGNNVGFNADQTAPPGNVKNYQWFAGKWISSTETVPYEFGSVALSAADPMNQSPSGLIGALVIEPKDAVWKEDINFHSSANVFDKNGAFLFREFVLQFQDNLLLPNTPQGYKGAIKAINYKSEPLINRLGNPGAFFVNSNDTALTSNVMNGGQYPETPHLVAKAGQPLRIRLVNSDCNGTGETFNLHGHVWQEEPYIAGSTMLGDNPKSQYFGYRDQLGARSNWDLLIKSAGGANKVAGDYLYNSTTNLTFYPGMWGILSVTDKKDFIHVNAIHSKSINSRNFIISGWVTVNPETGRPSSDSISLAIAGLNRKTVAVSPDGYWKFINVGTNDVSKKLVFSTTAGGALESKLGALLTSTAKVTPQKLKLYQQLELKKLTYPNDKGVAPQILPGKKNN